MVVVINQLYNIGRQMLPYFCFMSKENYAIGHAFTATDMFMNFPIDKLVMTPEECSKTYPSGKKRSLAASMFIDSVKMVINDIIENNTHFKLPTMGQTQAYLYMRKFKGDKFKRAFRKGKFRDIDFIESDYCGYQIGFEMQSKKRLPRNKLVYLSPKDKNRITNYTNNGKQY